ncbi:hypothetical protein KSP40_PGU003430 [Platanthera guangdongensis]|uniref:Uncharacterized protein n=1 Tax=Platanthera guangdongensis TaxID=2320717 RepID=A0ABR2MJ72_9ASPA
MSLSGAWSVGRRAPLHLSTHPRCFSSTVVWSPLLAGWSDRRPTVCSLTSNRFQASLLWSHGMRCRNLEFVVALLLLLGLSSS